MADAKSREALRLTLQGLDDADPTLWDVDGFPILDQVKRLSGIPRLSRQELNEIGRVRDMSRVSGPKSAKSNGHDTVAAISEAEAAEAVADAQRALDVARDNERAANVRLRSARAGIGKAILEFQHGTKKDAATIHREGCAREQARKLAVANGEIRENEMPLPAFQSAIDAQAYFSKGGKAGGKYNAYRRGASPVRLPSQR
jgi:hypothetical protein